MPKAKKGPVTTPMPKAAAFSEKLKYRNAENLNRPFSSGLTHLN
jgi:hypothetical protein